MGHQLQVHDDYTTAMGGGQAVMRDYAAGINYGASDPRKDGAAMAETCGRTFTAIGDPAIHPAVQHTASQHGCADQARA